ncbi:Lipoprotein [Enterobacter intestinihominis]
MYSRLLIICLATMLIASCVTNGSVPVVVDTGCDWVKPILLTDQDIDVLDRQTKKDILAHNKAWKANCGKN